MNELFTAVGSVAAAISLIFTAIQVNLIRKQNQSQFEESYTKQYRDTIKEIPFEALMKNKIDDKEIIKHFNSFYRYFDLCNEQIFKEEKISKETWKEWEEGMASILQRSSFIRAWELIQPGLPPGELDHLEAFLQKNSIVTVRKQISPQTEDSTQNRITSQS
jgi:hypothetical protein